MARNVCNQTNWFPPSRPIEEKLDDIQKSEIYAALKSFPKGGILHSHEGGYRIDMCLGAINRQLYYYVEPRGWAWVSRPKNSTLAFVCCVLVSLVK